MKKYLLRITLLVCLLIASISSVHALIESPDGTQYAIELNGDIRSGTFPTDTDGMRELLIETLKQIEDENKKKLTSQSNYDDLNILYDRAQAKILELTADIEEEIPVIDKSTEESTLVDSKWILLAEVGITPTAGTIRAPPNYIGFDLLYSLTVLKFNVLIGPSISIDLNDSSNLMTGLAFGIAL